jgi:C-terminal processing protease CtpA/Prc
VVKPGSRILSVDDEPVAARVARLKEEISAATQGWMNARLGKQLLSGEQGSTAKFRIKSPSGQEEEIGLLRDTHTTMVKDIRLPPPLAELRPGLWYVDLDRITEKGFKEALPRLSEARGVVFDLRGYPRISPDILGHLADQSMKWITGGVPIVTRPDRVGWTFTVPDKSVAFDIAPAQPRIKGRVAFLIGGGTISFPEAWMEIVEANKLGEIVGEPTGGTNGATNRIYLPGDYQIVWTGTRVTKMDGRRHHGIGILPTVPVSPTLRGITEGIDEVLDRGLEVVSR